MMMMTVTIIMDIMIVVMMTMTNVEGDSDITFIMMVTIMTMMIVTIWGLVRLETVMSRTLAVMAPPLISERGWIWAFVWEDWRRESGAGRAAEREPKRKSE